MGQISLEKYLNESIDYNMARSGKTVYGFPEGLSELEKFASAFHQDLDLLNESYESTGESYILSVEEHCLTELKKELSEFLTRHKSSSEQAVRKAWFKKGAHAHTKNLYIFLKSVEGRLESKLGLQ